MYVYIFISYRAWIGKIIAAEKKKGEEPDPNTPEGLEYWKSKYGIKERPGDRKPVSSFFSRALEVLYVHAHLLVWIHRQTHRMATHKHTLSLSLSHTGKHRGGFTGSPAHEPREVAASFGQGIWQV
jgi:hypothetical protein